MENHFAEENFFTKKLMDEVSLYRKYRPTNFDNLVGQDNIRTTLINSIKSGKVNHAYLFTGPRGTGKTSTARLLAKALNCLDPQDGYEPCGKCDFCNEITDGRLIDLIEIDAASNRGIDEVRDLKEKINFAPTRAKFKIYIIDEVHMMTKEAFNALLKTLEEPPAHAYFILATTEVHKIPETIISRCQRFDFKRISIKALMTRLSYICQKENIEAEDSALELISRYVDGGLRDAIGLVEQLTTQGKLTFGHVQDILGMSSYTLLDQLFVALTEKNTEAALKIINELHTQGSDLRQFVHEFVNLLREKMLEKIAENEKGEVAKYIAVIEIFQEVQGSLQYSIIPQLPLEIAVIQLCGDLPTAEISKKEEEKNNVPKKGFFNKKKEEAEKEKSEKINEDEKEIEKESTAPQVSNEEEILPLSLENLREKWPRITERVKSPALKMSLKSGLPVALDGTKVTLEFQTNFHKDKVVEHEYRVELEEVIKEIFGTGVKVIGKVKALEIRPVQEDERKEKTFVDQALEIFGGEVVEE